MKRKYFLYKIFIIFLLTFQFNYLIIAGAADEENNAGENVENSVAVNEEQSSVSTEDENNGAADEENNVTTEGENNEGADEENSVTTEGENNEGADEENSVTTEGENNEGADEENSVTTEGENNEGADEENSVTAEGENNEGADEENSVTTEGENNEGADEENSVTTEGGEDDLLVEHEGQYSDSLYGDESNIVMTPFLALIRTESSICTGTIISIDQILTSNRCIKTYDNNRIKVVVGATKDTDFEQELNVINIWRASESLNNNFPIHKYGSLVIIEVQGIRLVPGKVEIIPLEVISSWGKEPKSCIVAAYRETFKILTTEITDDYDGGEAVEGEVSSKNINEVYIEAYDIHEEKDLKPADEVEIIIDEGGNDPDVVIYTTPDSSKEITNSDIFPRANEDAEKEEVKDESRVRKINRNKITKLRGKKSRIRRDLFKRRWKRADIDDDDDGEEKPPENKEQPSETEEQPSETEEQPSETEEHLPGNEEQPPETEEHLPGNEEQSPETEEHLPGNEEQSPETEEKPTDTEEQPPETEEQPPGNVGQPPEKEQQPPETFEEEDEDDVLELNSKMTGAQLHLLSVTAKYGREACDCPKKPVTAPPEGETSEIDGAITETTEHEGGDNEETTEHEGGDNEETTEHEGEESEKEEAKGEGEEGGKAQGGGEEETFDEGEAGKEEAKRIRGRARRGERKIKESKQLRQMIEDKSSNVVCVTHKQNPTCFANKAAPLICDGKLMGIGAAVVLCDDMEEDYLGKDYEGDVLVNVNEYLIYEDEYYDDTSKKVLKLSEEQNQIQGNKSEDMATAAGEVDEATAEDMTAAAEEESKKEEDASRIIKSRNQRTKELKKRKKSRRTPISHGKSKGKARELKVRYKIGKDRLHAARSFKKELYLRKSLQRALRTFLTPECHGKMFFDTFTFVGDFKKWLDEEDAINDLRRRKALHKPHGVHVRGHASIYSPNMMLNLLLTTIILLHKYIF